MSAMTIPGMALTRSVGGRFRRRLRVPRLHTGLRLCGRHERPVRLATGISRSDVKAASAAGRSQDRQLMRGGRP